MGFIGVGCTSTGFWYVVNPIIFQTLSIKVKLLLMPRGFLAQSLLYICLSSET